MLARVQRDCQLRLHPPSLIPTELDLHNQTRPTDASHRASNRRKVQGVRPVYPLKLLAGDEYVVPIHSGTATIFLKADTATCEVEYVIVEA